MAIRMVGGAVRVLGAVRAVGVVWVVRVRGGSGHALAALKYSLNTYINL